MALGKELATQLLQPTNLDAGGAASPPAIVASKDKSAWDLLTSRLRDEVEEFAENYPLAKASQLHSILAEPKRFRIWTSLPPVLDLFVIYDVLQARILTIGITQGPSGSAAIDGPTFTLSEAGFTDADQARTVDSVVSSYLEILRHFFERLRTDATIQKRMQTEGLRRQAKLWACAVGFVYAIYGLFTAAQRGNAVFVLIIAGFTLITAWPDPGKLSGDLSDPVRLFFRALKNLSFKAILSSTAEILRRGFRNSDGVVRFLLMAISLGGTALVMKYGIRNFFLPDFIDIWVKRMGPAAVLIVVVLYPSYLTSKRIFLLSMNERDAVCRKYELCFYLSVLFLVVCIAAFFVGLPFEDLMQDVGIRSRRSGGPPPMWRYSGTTLRYLGSMCLIWLIWSIGFGCAIVSRFFEIAWRENPQR